jgi:hypothetical protein
MFFALLQTAPAVQSKGLIGGYGNAGMRPERRFKPGMDGGLTAAVLVSPPLHLRTPEILSKRWGPPQAVAEQVEVNQNAVPDLERKSRTAG